MYLETRGQTTVGQTKWRRSYSTRGQVPCEVSILLVQQSQRHEDKWGSRPRWCKSRHSFCRTGVLHWESSVDFAVALVFKLIDLATLCNTKLEQLGTVLNGHVHSTKLKNLIWRYFPDLEEQKRGWDFLLAYNQDVGAALCKACELDANSDAIHLARAANIVRRDCLQWFIWHPLPGRVGAKFTHHTGFYHLEWPQYPSTVKPLIYTSSFIYNLPVPDVQQLCMSTGPV